MLFCLAALLWPGLATASQRPEVSAVLLSDIHFDPFHDPRLLPQLQSAPIERWPAILNAAPSLTEDAERAALQLECHAVAFDTAWPLLKTTLAAARDAQPHPVFVTLSGDLLAHQFPCRFHHIARTAKSQDLNVFAAKTVAFVAQQLRLTFPHVPVYVALGNNDSGCADYAETPGSSFMQTAESAMLADAGQGAGANPRAVNRLRLQESPEGDYSLGLPAPLEHGRLIVLNDIYDAAGYRTCAGAADHTPETTQLAWLRTQLTQARTRGEQVWVMGHIPPGVDVFSSFAKYVLRPGEMCSAPVKEFLDDAALPDTLLDFADVVRLALFAHTHMDEVRLLHRGPLGAGTAAGGAVESPQGRAIPVKLVPSVTPYFGNHPAFLVVNIDPHTLVLEDWKTIVSPAPDGSMPPWTVGYDFRTTYSLPDFSAASVARLAAEFGADRNGRAPHSTAYREHFYAGGAGPLYALGLEQIWPAYGCAVREDREPSFHDCLCPAEAPKP